MGLKARLLRWLLPPLVRDPAIEARLQDIATLAEATRQAAAADRAVSEARLDRLRALAQMRRHDD